MQDKSCTPPLARLFQLHPQLAGLGGQVDGFACPEDRQGDGGGFDLAGQLDEPGNAGDLFAGIAADHIARLQAQTFGLATGNHAHHPHLLPSGPA